MQSEWHKYLLKHKFRGVHGGEQSWNHSNQWKRTMPPEVDGLENSPSQWPNQAEEWGEGQSRKQCKSEGAWSRLVSMKDYPHQALLADCLGEQAGSLRLVEQDWREHTAQTHNKTACKTTQQHYSATQETCNKKGKNYEQN